VTLPPHPAAFGATFEDTLRLNCECEPSLQFCRMFLVWRGQISFICCSIHYKIERAAARSYILYACTALSDHKFALAFCDKSRDMSSKNAIISPGGNVTASTGQLLANLCAKCEMLRAF
jgi:hypothetical protein